MVTLDGNPLPSGLITLDPASPESTTATAVEIVDGQLVFNNTNGPVPGKYNVSINSAGGDMPEPTEGTMPGDEFLPPMKEMVPTKYNSESTLTLEVVAGENPPANFDLTSQ